MSFEAMAWAVKHALPVKQKIVLLLLSDRTNRDTGLCIPAHSTLAAECGLSLASVKRAISELEELGLLSIQRRSQDGVSLPNRYLLNFGVVGSLRTDPPGQGDPTVGSQGATNQESNQEVKPGKKASSVGSRLPADWHLPKEWFDWAVKERPDLDINAQGEMFRDYWHAQAGAKGRKADWQATWRNWIRNARAARTNGFHAPVNNGAQPAVLGDFHDHPDFLP